MRGQTEAPHGPAVLLGCLLSHVRVAFVCAGPRGHDPWAPGGANVFWEPASERCGQTGSDEQCHLRPHRPPFNPASPRLWPGVTSASSDESWGSLGNHRFSELFTVPVLPS